MPGTIPNPVWLFRMIHISNLDYALTHGMHTRNHPDADPNYINIGDTGLIAQRTTHSVNINPPGGTLGEYVPFYFAGHSPMLYNIKTGYRGVTQRNQSEIVFVCCRLDVIIANCAEWCFTNGHAKNTMTVFYNNLNDLGKLDWNTIPLLYWNPIQADLQRQWRKQAEFLVKTHIPMNCIGGIIVYDQNAFNIVDALMKKLNLQIPFQIDQKREYFYS